MALLLSKSKRIVRETILKEVFGKYRGKTIIIEMLPSNELCFRIKGTQQRFTMHIAHALVGAKIVEAKAQHQKALERYAEKKKFGGRAKKPKKFFMPYSSAYIKAILG